MKPPLPLPRIFLCILLPCPPLASSSLCLLPLILPLQAAASEAAAFSEREAAAARSFDFEREALQAKAAGEREALQAKAAGASAEGAKRKARRLPLTFR